MPGTWELAAILAKSLLYFGVLTSAGLVIVRFAFTSLVHEILPAIQRFALFCTAVALTGALLGFVLRGAALTGDAKGMTDPAILGMMWQTPVGSALAFRITGLGAMMLGLIIGGVGWSLAFVGAGAALWSFSMIGHAADSSAFWTEFVLFLHLVAVSFWIGVIFPLGKLAGDPRRVLSAGKLGHRFGLIATAVIPLLVLAGVLLSWKLVGSWIALFTSDYGITLLAKLAGVICLLVLGALNKLQIVPKLAEGDVSADRSFAKVLKTEWLVFLLVLCTTATLTTLFEVPMT